MKRALPLINSSSKVCQKSINMSKINKIWGWEIAGLSDCQDLGWEVTRVHFAPMYGHGVFLLLDVEWTVVCRVGQGRQSQKKTRRSVKRM
jgi:hypothetical protein